MFTGLRTRLLAGRRQEPTQQRLPDERISELQRVVLLARRGYVGLGLRRLEVELVEVGRLVGRGVLVGGRGWRDRGEAGRAARVARSAVFLHLQTGADALRFGPRLRFQDVHRTFC